MKKVFLGGTCNGSLWRDNLIEKLKIDYYDPCKKHWTKEMMEEELRQRDNSDFCLYVLTPKMEGFYSIAEITDDSNKRPEKTIFCFLDEDGGETFNEKQTKSLKQLAKMVKGNGAAVFDTLDEIADFLNHQ